MRCVTYPSPQPSPPRGEGENHRPRGALPPLPLGERVGARGTSVKYVRHVHSLLALVVIPELRISDTGIVDVTRFEKVDLFV